MKAGVFIAKDYFKWRLKNLSKNASNVEMALWYFLDFTSATAKPSQAKLAKMCDTSLRSIQRGIDELLGQNIISRTHKKSAGMKQYFYNEYLFLNYKKNMMCIPNTLLTDDEVDKLIDIYLRKRGQKWNTK